MIPVDEVIYALNMLVDKFSRDKERCREGLEIKGEYCRVGNIVIKISQINDIGSIHKEEQNDI